MSELVIVGDQAYFPEEWARVERKRAKDRERPLTPEQRERRRAYFRAYRQRPSYKALHREANRRWRQKKRAKAAGPPRAGTLHSLGCLGAHDRPRKGCRPIPVYSKRLESVA